jgi:hypothetical protein
MYEKILKSSPDALLFNAYYALRRVSNIYPNAKYSWCNQMYDLLISVGKEAIWNKNSANYLCSFMSSVLYKHRQNLRAADFRKAKDSFTVPHYFNIVNGGGTEHYLRRGFPTYIVTCISQLRLNYSSIFNREKWFDFGMFKNHPVICVERGTRLATYSTVINLRRAD